MSAALILIACSCGAGFGTYPAHTATGVPTDVRPVVVGAVGQQVVSIELRAGTTPIAIAIETAVSGGWPWVTVTPEVPLQPATSYTLEVMGEWDGQITEFTTGSATAPPPTAPVVDSLAVARADIVGGGSSCYDGHVDEFRFEMQRDPGAAYHIVELRPEGGSPIALRTMYPERLTNSSCDFELPEVQRLQTWCAIITSMSPSGVASAPSSEVCAGADTCTVRPDEASPAVEACAAGCAAAGPGDSGLAALVLLLFVRRRIRRVC